MRNFKTMDGNEAAAYISYPFTEVAAIYPITPSTPMGEQVDEWASHGKKNLFGRPPRVVEMQSEAGAAGAVHGSLTAGAFTTTYTASQGLLLMIPNLYKMAAEFLPGVLHVSARAIATHALSIFGDHQDVMACRQTGVAMLASASVQEVIDLGLIAHLAAIESRVPFVHFFDGFRTSHEIQRVELIDYDQIESLLNHEAIAAFRERALRPERPCVRGTHQNPDVYFQGREVGNKFYMAVPEIVESYMNKLAAMTGRQYKLFDYYGAEDADRVIIAMGSACETINETVDYLLAQGEKVGAIRVRLYRPFSAEHFLRVLPTTVKRIAVLDRTKEPGSLGEPLYLDIVKVYNNKNERPEIYGGRYGLGSKDTTPSQILAVFENLKADQPKDSFTIGIVDDVYNTSLEEKENIDTSAKGTISCKIWGLGSDGTVGANKAAVKIVGEKTNLYPQGYFSYDSKKSGGITVSHLRFSPEPIRSPYLVYQADYIACHNSSFVNNFDLLQGIKKGGVFVLNCPWSDDEFETKLPASLRRSIAENEISFYTIDALSIAQKVGLGNRINMVMQSVFFYLTNIIPFKEAEKYLKDSIEELYGSKGRNIVEINFAAVDQAIENLKKVTVPASWKNAVDDEEEPKEEPAFITEIQRPMARLEGDGLPVSAFLDMVDGTYPVGTTKYEKRGIAVRIPQWQIDNCIQCNQCSFVCPHAVIRPLLLDENENSRAPEGFETKKAIGKDLNKYYYRIQISPLDCTGCGNCADICPAPEKALIMKPAEDEIENQSDNWEFGLTVTTKDVPNTNTLKGSQFLRPLFEFHSACPGCGETPYIKLLSQLFGDRLMIANATGCSSIYGGYAPSIPYTTTDEGKGPAWANSLFEDNAEFGYGMFLAQEYQRKKLAELMELAQNDEEIDPRLKEAFAEWLSDPLDADVTKSAAKKITSVLELDSIDKDAHPVLRTIYEKKDYLVKRSHWLIGGDGWAYDIGFGGLDHVLAHGEDVNVLVLDTEVYSNTGGQASKATQTGAVAKFAVSGKRIRKKDLGLMMTSYGYVYVAQIALGANMVQAIRAINEAEAYKGPSLIIAYSPCINHGIKTGMGTSIAQEKKAVEAGYWHLYRYNPALKEQGKNPFILDSKEPTGSFGEFIESEIRYTTLANVFPEYATELFELAEKHAKERYETYKRLASLEF